MTRKLPGLLSFALSSAVNAISAPSLLLPMPRVLHLLLSAVTCTACLTEDDCSLAGACVHGRCIYRAPFWSIMHTIGHRALSSAGPWRLPKSVRLVLGRQPHSGHDDGMFHLFASQLTNGCGLLHYQTNSEVVHLVSRAAAGPYTFRDVALARRGPGHWDSGTVHGPTIRYDPSRREYVLFYMSTNFSGPSPVCFGNRSYPPIMVSHSRRIGVAWSKSLDGPWQRADAPIFTPSEEVGAWDAADVSNPAPVIADDGSVLLAYRAGGDHVAVGGGIGIAGAPSYRGPYTRLNHSMLFAAEDAVMWREPAGAGGHLHMLVHAFQGVGGRADDNVGGHAWSRRCALAVHDGAAYTLRVDWTNGTSTDLYRRERPQLLFSKAGKPHPLVQWRTATAGFDQIDCDFQSRAKHSPWSRRSPRSD